MNILKLLYKKEIEVKEISIFKAFIIITIFTIIPIITNIISTLIMLIINVDARFGQIMITNSIIIIIATMLMVVMAGKLLTNKNTIKINNYKIKITRNDFIHVFFIIIGYILIRDALLLGLLSKFDGPITDEDINFLTNNSSDMEVTLLMIIIWIQSIIVAPIFEELLFRGIILNGMLNKYKHSHKKAIIYSALIFGVVHLNIPQGINAFIAGLILGCIYYYTGSIKLSIFAHFINNLLIFIPIPFNIFIKTTYVILGIYLIIKGTKYIKIKSKLKITVS